MQYPKWITLWHNKAKPYRIFKRPEDSFTGFIFEYISFIAALNRQVYENTLNQSNCTIIRMKNAGDVDAIGLYNKIMNSHNIPDRSIIQILKNSDNIKPIYLNMVHTDIKLKTAWNEVINRLDSEPLINSSRGNQYAFDNKYWNYPLIKSPNNLQICNPIEYGKVHNLNDWENMIEFIYLIRNNLFHGTKSLEIERDQFLVRHGYQCLRPLVEILLNDSTIL